MIAHVQSDKVIVASYLFDTVNKFTSEAAVSLPDTPSLKSLCVLHACLAKNGSKAALNSAETSSCCTAEHQRSPQGYT